MTGARVDTVVLVCTSCRHWQIDVDRRAIRQLGAQGTLMAIAYAHAEHLDGDTPYSGEGECPNPGGRIKVGGQWVEPPKMSDEVTPARGVMEATPLPAWWVAR